MGAKKLAGASSAGDVVSAPPDKPAPFLRWAGSKRMNLDFLKRFWTGAHSRYVEPFAGSCALFFSIRPALALLGDLNGDLIQTYQAVASDPVRVAKLLSRLPRGEEAYYDIRQRKAERMTPEGRAARFIYLNRFCFNGLYRTNTAGQFNVPYGAPKTPNVPDETQLESCAKLLRKADVRHADFRKTLAEVQRGDFVYLDPPYAVSNRRVFIEYGAAPFSASDLSDVADCLDRIAKQGATFVISYADCKEARRALSGWKVKRRSVRRNVAGFAGARRVQYELYATNSDLAFGD